MSKTCLICTDFTDGLQRLTEFVPDLAQSNFSHIIFFHSVSLEKQGQIPKEDSQEVQEAKTRLASAQTNVPEGVQVSIEITSGNPSEGINRILKKYQVDVIILGTPIRGGWQETIFGSTTTSIAKVTDIPLLIIRPQLISTYTREELSLRCQHLFRYILITYDDSENSHYCIKRLKNHIESFPATKIKGCMLLTVVSDVGRSQEVNKQKVEQAKIKIEEVKQEVEKLGLHVNTEVRQGDEVAETLKAALHFDISMIAVANDYQSNPLQWTVPNFAQELIRRSWYPLLFFSPKR